MAQECGLAAVALHARTREQGYSGQARWEWIAALKDAVSIPVIGNGDVRSPEDAAAMVAQTGCDAVMIGRTAASNPWIFRQIEQYTLTGRYDLPTEADRYEMIRTYFAMLVEERMPGAAGKMKQFASWFTHGVAHGAHLRKSVYEAKSETRNPRRGGSLLSSKRWAESWYARIAVPAEATSRRTGHPELVVCSRFNQLRSQVVLRAPKISSRSYR